MNLNKKQAQTNWNQLKVQPMEELRAKEQFYDKIKTMAVFSLLIKKGVFTIDEMLDQIRLEEKNVLEFINQNKDILTEMKVKEHKENRPDYSG